MSLARLGRAPEATTGAHRQQGLPQRRHVDHEEPQVPLRQVLRLIELRRPSVDAIQVLPELFGGPHDDSLGLLALFTGPHGAPGRRET